MYQSGQPSAVNCALGGWKRCMLHGLHAAFRETYVKQIALPQGRLINRQPYHMQTCTHYVTFYMPPCRCSTLHSLDDLMDHITTRATDFRHRLYSVQHLPPDRPPCIVYHLCPGKQISLAYYLLLSRMLLPTCTGGGSERGVA